MPGQEFFFCPGTKGQRDVASLGNPSLDLELVLTIVKFLNRCELINHEMSIRKTDRSVFLILKSISFFSFI